MINLRASELWNYVEIQQNFVADDEYGIFVISDVISVSPKDLPLFSAVSQSITFIFAISSGWTTISISQ